MNILLVDDHVLFREGLKFLLSDLNNDIDFYEAGSCEEAVCQAISGYLDLIILDFYLPDSEDFRSIIKVKDAFQGSNIVIVSGEENPDIIHEAIDNGASGYIPKSSSQEILVAALELILAGGIYLPHHALNNYKSKTSSPHISDSINRNKQLLTTKQQEAIMLAVQGMPNKLIAREMNIAEGTVKAHLSNSFQILGVKNRTEAVYALASQGMLESGKMSTEG